MNPDPSAFQVPAANHVSLPGLPALDVGMHTDSGRDPNKQVNEDAMMARETPHGHLAVVCDGMGGHVGGREASHLAIDMIFRTVDATPPGTPPGPPPRPPWTPWASSFVRVVRAAELMS